MSPCVQPFNEGDRRRRRARHALTAKISTHADESGVPGLAPPILHPQPDPEG
jgi:hypothetical protein